MDNEQFRLVMREVFGAPHEEMTADNYRDFGRAHIAARAKFNEMAATGLEALGLVPLDVPDPDMPLYTGVHIEFGLPGTVGERAFSLYNFLQDKRKAIGLSRSQIHPGAERSDIEAYLDGKGLGYGLKIAVLQRVPGQGNDRNWPTNTIEIGQAGWISPNGWQLPTHPRDIYADILAGYLIEAAGKERK